MPPRLSDRVEQIESSKDFRIGEIDFHPFTIPHDAVDNFGFTATHQGVKIATLMDFGHITTLVTEQLRGCAAILIESNHSRDMLKACDSYPWELKQRILSRLGHLSNEDVADWLRDGFDGIADHIVLAHLSQRANNPYLAKISAEVALQERSPLFHCGHADKSFISQRNRRPGLRFEERMTDERCKLEIGMCQRRLHIFAPVPFRPVCFVQLLFIVLTSLSSGACGLKYRATWYPG